MLVHDEPIVDPQTLTPFRPADTPASGPARPFGVTLAAPGTGTNGDPAVELGYCHTSQIATIDGHPAIATPCGEALMTKKANTVEDSQRDTEEVNR